MYDNQRTTKRSDSRECVIDRFIDVVCCLYLFAYQENAKVQRLLLLKKEKNGYKVGYKRYGISKIKIH